MEIGGINPKAFETFLKERGKEVKSPEDFTQALKEFIEWVNSQQENAKQIKEAVLRGEDVPLHRMIVEFQKAGVALNLMIEVRNRLLEGYQELLRMQV
ncbi:MAG: flagellar hook-basal body complex protein FliE [Aquificae bacterium]|nr:flagellar hook-basal body complex protein FliE [Aquificota bacterium]